MDITSGDDETKNDLTEQDKNTITNIQENINLSKNENTSSTIDSIIDDNNVDRDLWKPSRIGLICVSYKPIGSIRLKPRLLEVYSTDGVHKWNVFYSYCEDYYNEIDVPMIGTSMSYCSLCDTVAIDIESGSTYVDLFLKVKIITVTPRTYRHAKYRLKKKRKKLEIDSRNGTSTEITSIEVDPFSNYNDLLIQDEVDNIVNDEKDEKDTIDKSSLKNDMNTQSSVIYSMYSTNKENQNSNSNNNDNFDNTITHEPNIEDLNLTVNNSTESLLITEHTCDSCETIQDETVNVKLETEYLVTNIDETLRKLDETLVFKYIDKNNSPFNEDELHKTRTNISPNHVYDEILSKNPSMHDTTNDATFILYEIDKPSENRNSISSTNLNSPMTSDTGHDLVETVKNEFYKTIIEKIRPKSSTTYKRNNLSFSGIVKSHSFDDFKFDTRRTICNNNVSQIDFIIENNKNNRKNGFFVFRSVADLSELSESLTMLEKTSNKSDSHTNINENLKFKPIVTFEVKENGVCDEQSEAKSLVNEKVEEIVTNLNEKISNEEYEAIQNQSISSNDDDFFERNNRKETVPGVDSEVKVDDPQLDFTFETNRDDSMNNQEVFASNDSQEPSVASCFNNVIEAEENQKVEIEFEIKDDELADKNNFLADLESCGLMKESYQDHKALANDSLNIENADLSQTTILVTEDSSLIFRRIQVQDSDECELLVSNGNSEIEKIENILKVKIIQNEINDLPSVSETSIEFVINVNFDQVTGYNLDESDKLETKDVNDELDQDEEADMSEVPDSKDDVIDGITLESDKSYLDKTGESIIEFDESILNLSSLTENDECQEELKLIEEIMQTEDPNSNAHEFGETYEDLEATSNDVDISVNEILNQNVEIEGSTTEMSLLSSNNITNSTGADAVTDITDISEENNATQDEVSFDNSEIIDRITQNEHNMKCSEGNIYSDCSSLHVKSCQNIDSSLAIPIASIDNFKEVVVNDNNRNQVMSDNIEISEDRYVIANDPTIIENSDLTAFVETEDEKADLSVMSEMPDSKDEAIEGIPIELEQNYLDRTTESIFEIEEGNIEPKQEHIAEQDAKDENILNLNKLEKHVNSDVTSKVNDSVNDLKRNTTESKANPVDLSDNIEITNAVNSDKVSDNLENISKNVDVRLKYFDNPKNWDDNATSGYNSMISLNSNSNQHINTIDSIDKNMCYESNKNRVEELTFLDSALVQDDLEDLPISPVMPIEMENIEEELIKIDDENADMSKIADSEDELIDGQLENIAKLKNNVEFGIIENEIEALPLIPGTLIQMVINEQIEFHVNFDQVTGYNLDESDKLETKDVNDELDQDEEADMSEVPDSKDDVIDGIALESDKSYLDKTGESIIEFDESILNLSSSTENDEFALRDENQEDICENSKPSDLNSNETYESISIDLDKDTNQVISQIVDIEEDTTEISLLSQIDNTTDDITDVSEDLDVTKYGLNFMNSDLTHVDANKTEAYMTNISIVNNDKLYKQSSTDEFTDIMSMVNDEKEIVGDYEQESYNQAGLNLTETEYLKIDNIDFGFNENSEITRFTDTGYQIGNSITDAAKFYIIENHTNKTESTSDDDLVTFGDETLALNIVKIIHDNESGDSDTREMLSNDNNSLNCTFDSSIQSIQNISNEKSIDSLDEKEWVNGGDDGNKILIEVIKSETIDKIQESIDQCKTDIEIVQSNLEDFLTKPDNSNNHVDHTMCFVTSSDNEDHGVADKIPVESKMFENLLYLKNEATYMEIGNKSIMEIKIKESDLTDSRIHEIYSKTAESCFDTTQQLKKLTNIGLDDSYCSSGYHSMMNSQNYHGTQETSTNIGFDSDNLSQTYNFEESGDENEPLIKSINKCINFNYDANSVDQILPLYEKVLTNFESTGECDSDDEIENTVRGSIDKNTTKVGDVHRHVKANQSCIRARKPFEYQTDEFTSLSSMCSAEANNCLQISDECVSVNSITTEEKDDFVCFTNLMEKINQAENEPDRPVEQLNQINITVNHTETYDDTRLFESIKSNVALNLVRATDIQLLETNKILNNVFQLDKQQGWDEKYTSGYGYGNSKINENICVNDTNSPKNFDVKSNMDEIIQKKAGGKITSEELDRANVAHFDKLNDWDSNYTSGYQTVVPERKQDNICVFSYTDLTKRSNSDGDQLTSQLLIENSLVNSFIELDGNCVSVNEIQFEINEDVNNSCNFDVHKKWDESYTAGYVKRNENEDNCQFTSSYSNENVKEHSTIFSVLFGNADNVGSQLEANISGDDTCCFDKSTDWDNDYTTGYGLSVNKQDNFEFSIINPIRGEVEGSHKETIYSRLFRHPNQTIKKEDLIEADKIDHSQFEVQVLDSNLKYSDLVQQTTDNASFPIYKYNAENIKFIAKSLMRRQKQQDYTESCCVFNRYSSWNANYSGNYLSNMRVSRNNCVFDAYMDIECPSLTITSVAKEVQAKKRTKQLKNFSSGNKMERVNSNDLTNFNLIIPKTIEFPTNSVSMLSLGIIDKSLFNIKFKDINSLYFELVRPTSGNLGDFQIYNFNEDQINLIKPEHSCQLQFEDNSDNVCHFNKLKKWDCNYTSNYALAKKANPNSCVFDSYINDSVTDLRQIKQITNPRQKNGGWLLVVISGAIIALVRTYASSS